MDLRSLEAAKREFSCMESVLPKGSGSPGEHTTAGRIGIIMADSE
jgi:hypothetical protein